MKITKIFIVDQEYELNLNILDKSPKEIFAYAVQNKNEIKIAETNLEIAKKSLELNKVFFSPDYLHIIHLVLE